ncbi:PDR/VanB family oxidoreductase [Streptomyces sp. LHD-70]|uniref:PDR/VanB family oxidoreductase n=1 Tax=Streptomyces sp. LHD-70 TaxID=3072140 RepID=UPI00280E9C08|nr:PDR/VanB family oxidoreductase [Streptomyces sp. LHD-70]MDQ8704095.1 PDR/VanB family oxidoreductase [Streptomyces sp. LHD-70]
MSVVSDSTSLKLRVTRRTVRAVGVVELEFSAVDGADLPQWEPGAHLELRLPSALLRQYSLCGDPAARDTYVVCVQREANGRGGSVEAYDRLEVGVEVTGSAPRNHFPLVDAPEFILIAGGIGITPLKSMAEDLHRRGISWRLVYGGRSRRCMAFADELATAHPDRVTLVPQDEVGLPDLDRVVASVSQETRVYCCGPAPMLAAVTEACARAGCADRLHIERFSAADASPDTGVDSAFEVELHRSGTTLTVSADQSLLEAIRAVRPDIDSSCQEGYCGTCETRVLDGEPEHRGTLMSPDEHEAEGTMLLCVGRARSAKLVLDL